MPDRNPTRPNFTFLSSPVSSFFPLSITHFISLFMKYSVRYYGKDSVFTVQISTVYPQSITFSYYSAPLSSLIFVTFQSHFSVSVSGEKKTFFGVMQQLVFFSQKFPL